MQIKDLQPKCKIKNKLWYELIIDKIIDNEIYTSWWNMNLTKFDRLRWTKDQVQKQIETLWWVSLDGKIRITKAELMALVQQRIWDYQIKEFQSPSDRDDKEIIDKQLKAWDIVYVEWVAFSFVWYADNNTVLSLSTEWQTINIIVEDENLKHYSFKANSKAISLADAIKRIYNEDSSLVVITD